jgi:hypothetical protein
MQKYMSNNNPAENYPVIRHGSYILEARFVNLSKVPLKNVNFL